MPSNRAQELAQQALSEFRNSRDLQRRVEKAIRQREAEVREGDASIMDDFANEESLSEPCRLIARAGAARIRARKDKDND